MLTPTPQKNSHAILLTSELWAGLQPAELFAMLSDHPSLFWLDSGASTSAWSYFGIHCLASPQKKRILDLSLASARRKFALRFEYGAPFKGGWLVRINYPAREHINRGERASAVNSLCAYYYPIVLAYNHSTHAWICYANDEYNSRRVLKKKSENFVAYCENIIEARQNTVFAGHVSPTTIISSQQNYISSVNKALNYISDGDIYQVNIASRFQGSWKGSPAELYLRMRAASSASYGAYLGPGLSDQKVAVCSLSPELFLNVRNGRVITRPIKGTRPLAATDAGTHKAALELSASPKERAELNMIVDLERNDLGRVCKYGSVKVDSPGVVETLPTLLHRTATISGELRRGVTFGDLIAATFPGGSITGAPKIRAMQIISELEDFERGPYCGAIGWAGPDGNLDLNIAIRTAVCDPINHTVVYCAGSGIVADSDPQLEYEETLLKAKPFLKAINAELVDE